ncbi:hypothetical protein EV175_004980 [Coemansia sp. RSA 1933]|nr:hypothetical protein EV175_004980 [Coemansia sp. RSA 1933]
MSSKSANGSDLPKIQLESKEDVEFLQHQFHEFLQKTVANNTTLRDTTLSDEQRQEAEALVLSKLEEWTKSIWTMAGTSMAINGLPFDEAMQEKSRIEPLDEELRTQVQGLREEADELLLSVTQKRRTVPDQIERLVSDGVMRESLVAENTTAIKGLQSTVDADLPYIDDSVNAEFAHAVVLAKKLGSEAPPAIGKMKRLLATLDDAKNRPDTDDDVKTVLIDGSTVADSASAEGIDTQKQLLAYKAALHAISKVSGD